MQEFWQKKFNIKLSLISYYKYHCPTNQTFEWIFNSEGSVTPHGRDETTAYNSSAIVR